MDPTLELRRVQERDLAQVGALTAGVYVAGGFLPAEADYVAELRDAVSRAAGAEVWVVVDGEERVLGSVAFCPEGSAYREVARTGEGEFRMLAVDPAARGRGIGGALVRRCIERAREEGCGALVLCTMPGMDAARRMYERLGFERVPERDWTPVREVCLHGFRLSLASSGPGSAPDRRRPG